jgi:putative oxidoreductase
MSLRAREIAKGTDGGEVFSSLGGDITAAFELSGQAQPEEISATRLNSVDVTHQHIGYAGTTRPTRVRLEMRGAVKFMKALKPLALLGSRWVLALIYIYHGYPKLAHPSDAMRDFFVSHGLPGYFLSVAGILESFGALLLFLGLFTRTAGLLLMIEMCVAIWKVHSTNGILAVKDYEFPLALAAACFVLTTVGAGTLSLDRLFFGDRIKKGRFAKGV